MTGLLGFGSFGQPPKGLLGPYYDPAEERRKKIFGAMSAAGAALLQGGQGNFGQVLGQGLAGAAQGAQQAGQDYQQQSVQYGQLAQQQEEARQKQQQHAAIMEWVDKLPPDQQGIAMAFPDKAAEAYLNSQGGAKPTNDIQEYNYAKSQGFTGTLQDWIVNNKKAGAISVDARNMGTIPPGYQVEYDQQGRPIKMVPIPGGPAAAEQQKATDVAKALENKQMTMTDTIVGAAAKARDLIGLSTTGIGGQVLSNIGQTDAGELYRQTAVLKSTATIENLNAMRRESPTGGALGNVTEKEGAMLAAAAGALDPAAGPERYKQALDNYELTLLRIVHGYDNGNKIFQQTRQQPQQSAPQSPLPSTGSAPVIRTWNPNTGKLE